MAGVSRWLNPASAYSVGTCGSLVFRITVNSIVNPTTCSKRFDRCVQLLMTFYSSLARLPRQCHSCDPIKKNFTADSSRTLDMTRVTNFGIKRTYLQAGFSDSATEPAREGGDEGPEAGGDEGPPKKRKRVRKRKPKKVDGAPGESEREENNAQKAETGISRVKLKATRKNKEGRSKNDRRQASSENRRIMRIQERRADTTCFVCREKGHTAKECQTTAKTQMEDAGRSVVGICYRYVLVRTVL